MKMKDLAVGRGQETFYLDVDAIVIDEGYNVRDLTSPDNVAHIRQIADAVKAVGVVSFPPISVYKDAQDNIHLVTGHCRVAGFKLAKSEGCEFKGILAVANNMSEQDRVLDLLSSNSGKALTMLEKASVVKKLLAFGWSVEDIARKHGVSTTAINNMLTILEAPQEIKTLVQEGSVSATTAVEIIQEHGQKAAVEVLETAVENAKERGKTKATAKDLPSKIQKITVDVKKGLGVYVFKSKKPDNFEADLDVGDFPCSCCSNRKDFATCNECKFFIEANDEA